MSSSDFPLRLATEPVVCATLEDIARAGARRALQQAIEDEVAEYIHAHRDQLDPAGHRLVVRNGHIQISCKSALAAACWPLGSLSSTLAVLCTQHRCWPVEGNTLANASQKPRLPSPVAPLKPPPFHVMIP